MRICYSIFFLFLCLKLHAQEPYYSQLYSTPLQLNPGYAGSAGCSRVIVSGRMQYPGYPQQYNRFHLSYDHFVPKIKAGVGLNFNHFYEGHELARTTQIGYVHSQHFQIMDDRIVLKPAIELVYKHRSLDNKFLGYRPVNVFDVFAGLVAYSQDIYGGIAVYHIAEPQETHWPVAAAEPIELRSRFHFGFNLWLREDVAISPNMSLYHEQSMQSVQLGLTLNHLNYSFGVVYWDLDVLIFQFRYNKDKWRFGYSYDLSIVQYGPSQYSAHELTLGFLFNCKNKRDWIIMPRKIPI
jgi:type IX secretion system PorP/SprF family membrane protein